jgi:hypothetical protein
MQGQLRTRFFPSLLLGRRSQNSSQELRRLGDTLTPPLLPVYGYPLWP